jgi:hypothetical protein
MEIIPTKIKTDIFSISSSSFGVQWIANTRQNRLKSENMTYISKEDIPRCRKNRKNKEPIVGIHRMELWEGT